MKLFKTVLVCMFFTLSIAGFAQAVEIGELDASFGDEGRVETVLGSYQDQAYAVTVQSDGKILVGGSSANGSNLDFALVRYNEDGTLDQGFNIDGIVTTQIGRDDDEVAALAVQENGHIIAAGYSVIDGSRDFALARYMPDGELDYSFGQGGVVITDYGSMGDEITALAVDTEGRVVVAGYSTGTTGRAVVIARYLPGGVLDLTFGYEGMSLTGIGDDALARSIDVDDLGRIVVAGSYTYEQRTGVMVLRFTDDGELDSDFGTDGLAVSSYVQSSTEGFGIKVHESGAILVAGSVGGAGEIDTALFLFGESGQPEVNFGDNGMLVTEVSREDDMALAVDIHGDGISLSGFATVDGEREFLFVSHQVEVVQNERVSFSLKTGSSTTSLRIAERQDVDSFNDFQPDPVNGTIEVVQTVVSTTPFGIFSDNISYAVALQPDGNAVTAGFTEQGGLTSFAVARYGATTDDIELTAAIANAGVSWIVTKEPFEVTRTGAISGGIISDTGKTITKRGVVFSIAPDPTFDEGSDSPDNPPPDNPDAPVISIVSPPSELPSGTAKTDMEVTTDKNADCSYSLTDTDYDSMTPFSATGGVKHVQEIDPLVDGEDYTYFVRCKDTAGNTNTISKKIFFSVRFGPNITASTPSGEQIFGTTQVDMSVTTGGTATCKYTLTKNTAYDDIIDTFTTTGGTVHVQLIGSLASGESYTYYIRCEDTLSGDQNDTDYEISFSVASSAARILQQVELYAGSVGSLFVSTAHAQSTAAATATPSSGTGIFEFSSPDYLTEGKTEDGAGPGSYSSIMKNLKPGTFFYVRAYALTSDGEVFYGDQLTFQTADSCFVATAAYGSLFHPYVQVLRDFRDQYLLTSAPGRMFVEAYYRLSPPAADFISQHPLARWVVQVALLPLVGLGWLLLQFGAGLFLLMVPVVLVSGIFAHRSWRRTHAV